MLSCAVLSLRLEWRVWRIVVRLVMENAPRIVAELLLYGLL